MKILIIISVLASPILGQLYPPYGFFSTMDMTSVTWANGVNSQKALNETLTNPLVKMIEADVCRGREIINGSETLFEIPIMAEPPSTTSDLSFKRFLNTVIDYNRDKPVDQRKGIKLDFKDYYSAATAVIVMRLRNITSNGTALQFPVWLNADLTRESDLEYANSPDKITVNQIIKLHKMSLPNAVLSLWWNSTRQSTSYTRQNFVDMVSDLRKEFPTYTDMEELPITFNLKAKAAINSLGNIMYLLNSTSFRSTVTLNAKDNDPPLSPVVLNDFLKVVGKQRSFVDAPFELQQNSVGSLGFNNFVYLVISWSLRYFSSSLCK